jgi:two-component system, chemotaxis family, response regulator PixG
MMPLTIQPTPDSFTAQLVHYGQNRFTGRLDVKVSTGDRWSLYLHLGRLVWATGGRHPVRRWQRHLVRHCPGVNPQLLTLRHNEQPECWDYHALGLFALRKIPHPEQLSAILQGIISEVLFDLLRAIAIASVNYTSARLNQTMPMFADMEGEDCSKSFEIDPIQGVRPSKSGMLPHTSMLAIETALECAQIEWQNWVAAGLTNCSPDLAPILTDVLALQEKTASNVYKKLVTAVDGKRTLRDLAAMTNRDVLAVTRSLIPYIRQQFVKLVQASDISRPGSRVRKTSAAKPPQAAPITSRQPLIAGIDDSPKILAHMEEILSSTGCRFLAIPDPVQALPTLIQYKPDLIFLDLAMPIANGYEICAQIRRVSQFQDIPVIILTGNDGLIDRMRSKVVGATDFLSKPVEAEKVLATVQKYCCVK